MDGVSLVHLKEILTAGIFIEVTVKGFITDAFYINRDIHFRLASRMRAILAIFSSSGDGDASGGLLAHNMTQHDKARLARSSPLLLNTVLNLNF